MVDENLVRGSMRAILGLGFLLVGMCCGYVAPEKPLNVKSYPPAKETLLRYEECITQFKEPSLTAESKEYEEIYRLLCYSTYPPVKGITAKVILIKKAGKVITLQTKTTSWEREQKGIPYTFKKGELSLEQWTKFKALFEKSKFWDVHSDIKLWEVDADEYVLECVVNGKYRYVCRSGIPEEKELARLIDWMSALVPERGE